MVWVSAGRLLRWATVAPLTIAGVAAAAAGAYLDVLAAAAFANPPAGALVPPTSRLVVLVPAHNEADFIGRCLETLNSQDYPPDLFEVAVVADNCTDATASIAASMPRAAAAVWGMLATRASRGSCTTASPPAVRTAISPAVPSYSAPVRITPITRDP